MVKYACDLCKNTTDDKRTVDIEFKHVKDLHYDLCEDCFLRVVMYFENWRKEVEKDGRRDL